ncbi:MAG: BolA family transcriptional regulator [Gammaproteobacteria bacterium]|nr:BolA family transcriptional regulator [Gammaproteobacteria bacterium]MBT8111494.1 BolA family transcriptional regulator [Gammaproteobacteria bacterium]NND47741.1 BolA family transcriptional regulator [Woeseiaceae bacterium]NNL46192.1 BolA family transcriptional regulator [Woeseiaceae bacterium]
MSSDRVKAIEAKLKEAFSPIKLLVKDQSHLHAGHEGAKAGGGHFDVTIVSQAFEGHRPLQRHRMIFSVLEPMMETDIHALRIRANTPDEL